MIWSNNPTWKLLNSDAVWGWGRGKAENTLRAFCLTLVIYSAWETETWFTNLCWNTIPTEVVTLCDALEVDPSSLGLVPGLIDGILIFLACAPGRKMGENSQYVQLRILTSVEVLNVPWMTSALEEFLVLCSHQQLLLHRALLWGTECL